ncbi:hypothetical protein J4434_04230 [Candidatus Woesearchaeota archaeon]|nr:hypothetical protein [Candidatus Woesearchaeota archaeon]
MGGSKISIDSTGGTDSTLTLEDRILHFNDTILGRINPDLPFLLVAGVTNAGKSSIIGRVRPVKFTELYAPPKFSEHRREGSSRLPLGISMSDGTTPDSVFDEETKAILGLAYLSYGEKVLYADSMYDDTKSKIFNLQVGSPAVVKELITKYQQMPNFVPVLINVQYTSHIQERIGVSEDVRNMQRYDSVKSYIADFSSQKQNFLAVFDNLGNPKKIDSSQIGSQIKSVAEKIEALLMYYIVGWRPLYKDFSDDDCFKSQTSSERFNNLKEMFHTHFVEHLLKNLYNANSIKELQQMIDIVEHTPANTPTHMYNLSDDEIMEIGSQYGMNKTGIISALKNLSPTEMIEENNSVLVLSHTSFKNLSSATPQYKQRLKEIFKEVLLRKYKIFSKEYVTTHLNGDFVASLTDDALPYIHAVKFKFD